MDNIGYNNVHTILLCTTGVTTPNSGTGNEILKESESDGEDMDMPIKQTGKGKIKGSGDDEVTSGSEEESEPRGFSTPRLSSKRDAFPESSDEDKPSSKRIASISASFTSADRDLLVRIERLLERIKSFLKPDKKV